ncbi:MAG: hypothetical protein QM757_38140 [Paludibaculum sp.]
MINEPPSPIDLCGGESVAESLRPYRLKNVRNPDFAAVIDEPPSIITAHSCKPVAKKSALLEVGPDHGISPEINEAEFLPIKREKRSAL